MGWENCGNGVEMGKIYRNGDGGDRYHVTFLSDYIKHSPHADLRPSLELMQPCGLRINRSASYADLFIARPQGR